MATPNQSTTLAAYMKRPDVLTKFTDMLGDSGKSYVQSVLIAVSASPELMKCTNESIFRSALRAASLGLSCDPALKQAWLVPYNKNIAKKNETPKWIKEAQFQPHYRGLYTLAMRTGKYWQINVAPVYEGQRVLENTLTGLHAVQDESGLIGKPQASNPAYTDVTVRRRSQQKIIGWIGYFKTKKGFEKSVWMSAIEIDDHARKYVRDYDKNPNWNDPEKRQFMEMKTVLRQLLSWADLSGSENSQLVEALQSEEPIEATAEDVPSQSEPVAAVMTYEQAQELRVETPWGNVKAGALSREKINEIFHSEMLADVEREALALILKTEYQAEPPEMPKRTQAQNMKELGFE